MDSRSKARELAVQAIYQLDVLGDYFLTQLGPFLRENADDEAVRRLAEEWTRGVWANIGACDDLIRSAALKWELSRLSTVDRSILRLGAYQLQFCKDMPGKVVINEAIEIAKKYSGEQAPRFVNGVLDAILKKLKTQD
ncbi:MAG: transcription antitermination factor NusB [Phycisphaerae bacterium]|nr:transcription antitermination factor NusB [Phycisphaerae bacterium]